MDAVMLAPKTTTTAQLSRRIRVSVLGATGSIGEHTAWLLAQNPERFETIALTAHNNAALLAETAIRLNAKHAILADESAYADLKQRLAGTGIQAAAGEKAIIEAATLPVDRLVAGVSGFAGLKPTLAAIEAGNHVALANKECLVAAGPVFMQAAARHQTMVLPVDSEHNAIFQVWDPARKEAIEKVTLTASGGPFRGWATEQMRLATPEQAVSHPNWRMGAKISVDSASMMNKGLELIEAHYLFDIAPEKLDVLVHPESIVHSLVHYNDGSVLAQLGLPDMCTPISYCLTWPDRLAVARPKLDLANIGRLHFEAPDFARFPCLALAMEAMRAGAGATTILNAANEIAVAAFLDARLRFTDIAKVVANVLEQSHTYTPDSLEAVIELDRKSRQLATKEASKLAC